MNFDDVREGNIKKINNIKKQIKKNPNDINMKRQLEINEKINELFEEGESIFFKMSMDDSIKILEQILTKEEAMKFYLESISPENYGKLLKKFEI